jgi:glycosyltransferase involved in cell wall biosynthesis
MLKLSILHPYIQERLSDLNDGTYPKNHYWGADALLNSNVINSAFIKSRALPIPNLAASFINRKLFSGYSDFNNELNALNASRSSDVLYSICGPIGLASIYRNCKLISWVFQINNDNKLNPLSPYNKKNLRKHTGFLCLTPNAQKYYSQFAPAKFIPWCVDLELFDGKSDKAINPKPYFLATGKTGRDYSTLVEAAYSTKADIRIIGPKEQKPSIIPENLIWIDSSKDPPDQAIDYHKLKEWYAHSCGVCIPLSGDANDTCGYTNMLEGMAMQKPILMTRSGCLHINPESRDFGILIEPKDSHGWSNAMNRILNEPNFAYECGNSGRKIVEKEFSIERFNRDVLSFITKILQK